MGRVRKPATVRSLHTHGDDLGALRLATPTRGELNVITP
jgi:hypothetical protein